MFRAVLLLCAVLSAGLVSGPADARSRDRNNDAEQHDDDRSEKKNKKREERGNERREGEWTDRRQSAKDAARLAQMRNGGGQVLSVDPVGNGHRVKVLKDGVVRVYVVED